jgi:hypothetical protein
VREYLLKAPTWVLSIIQGTVFGTLMGVYYSFNKTPMAAAISGLVAGVLFGALMGPVSATRRRKALDAVGLTPELSLQARHTAFRGPIPDDEGVRQAAIRVLLHQRSEARRTRLPTIAVFMIFVGLGLYLAVSGVSVVVGSMDTALFAVALAVQLWTPRRLGRRLDRLRAGGS